MAYIVKLTPALYVNPEDVSVIFMAQEIIQDTEVAIEHTYLVMRNGRQMSTTELSIGEIVNQLYPGADRLIEEIDESHDG